MSVGERLSAAVIGGAAVAMVIWVTWLSIITPTRPSPHAQGAEAEWALYCPGEIVRVDETSGDIYLRRLDVSCPWSGERGTIRVSAQPCDTIGEVLVVLERAHIKCEAVPWNAKPHAVAVPLVK